MQILNGTEADQQKFLWHFYPREGAGFFAFKRGRFAPAAAESEASSPASKRHRADSESETGAVNPAVNHRLCKLIVSDNVYMSRIFGNSPPNGNDILISAAFSSASWRSMEAAWNCYKEFLLLSKLSLDKEAPCHAFWTSRNFFSFVENI